MPQGFLFLQFIFIDCRILSAISPFANNRDLVPLAQIDFGDLVFGKQDKELFIIDQFDADVLRFFGISKVR